MDGNQADKDTGASSSQRSAGMRTCIIILGMHRSGTSAFARAVNLLGAALPKTLLEASSSNAAGHWEPLHLMQMHEHLLADADSGWADWRRLDLSALPPARIAGYREEVRRFLETECSGADLLVIKEPRICRFVPLFTEALAESGFELRFVIPVRNPLEVIESLAARDATGRSHAILLWLRHVLDAEAATRGSKRIIVPFEGFLSDSKATCRAMAEALSLSWPVAMEDAASQIEVFVDPARRHYVRTAEDVADCYGRHGWASEAYDALTTLAQMPDDASAMATLDRIAGEIDAAAPILNDMLAKPRSPSTTPPEIDRDETIAENFREHERQLSAARQEIRARDNELVSLRELLARRDGEIARLEAGMSEARERLDKAAQDARERQAVASALSTYESLKRGRQMASGAMPRWWNLLAGSLSLPSISITPIGDIASAGDERHWRAGPAGGGLLISLGHEIRKLGITCRLLVIGTSQAAESACFRLYYDFGDGFSQPMDQPDHTITFAGNSVSVEAIVSPPAPIAGLRIEPVDQPCEFVLEGLQFRPVPSIRLRKAGVGRHFHDKGGVS